MAGTVQVVAAPDRATPGPARRPPRRRTTARLVPYLLILPTLALIGALILYPIGQMVWMSFHKVGLLQVRGAAPADNVGWSNYHAVLNDSFFWHVLLNTVLSAAAMVAITLIFGTLVGLLLNRLGKKMSLLVAGGSLLAWATPAVSAAIVFKWLFSPSGGLIPWLLDELPSWLGGGGWSDYNWFNQPLSTYSVLVLCVVWQSFPFIAVSVLAGLRSVPSELYEAARVDGAGGWTTFWKITFPLLRPVFGVLLVLSVIWDFKVFTQLFFLSGGMANRDSYNLALYSYSTALSFPARFGLGGAIAVVFTAIVLIVTGVYVRSMIKQGEVA